MESVVRGIMIPFGPSITVEVVNVMGGFWRAIVGESECGAVVDLLLDLRTWLYAWTGG